MSFKMKGPTFFKESIKGYRKDSPDKNEEKLIIPSGNISMKGVEFPVHGIDNKGNEKVMEPGKNYKFPGDKVLETPMKHPGHGNPPGHIHKTRPDADNPEQVLSDEEMYERDRTGQLDWYFALPDKKEKKIKSKRETTKRKKPKASATLVEVKKIKNKQRQIIDQ